VLKAGQGFETFCSRQKIPYIDYSAWRKVVTGSLGASSLIQFEGMASGIGRWVKGKETVDDNINQIGVPSCCCCMIEEVMYMYLKGSCMYYRNKIIS